MFDLLSSDNDYFYLGDDSKVSDLESIDSTLSQFLSVSGGKTAQDGPAPALAAELRSLKEVPSLGNYPSGIYLRRSAGRIQGLLVANGGMAVGPYSISSLYVLSDPAFDLFQKFDDWWNKAESIQDSPPFAAGDWALHKYREEFVQIAHVVWNEGGYSVQIDSPSSGRSVVLPAELQILPGDPKKIESWRRQTPATGADFVRTIAWAKLHYPLTNTLYSFAATRTIFRPYQFLPALKMIKSQRGRILVADEVGLGKTIEAGLIWTELEQRQKLNKVLVIAPSSLLVKWRREMRDRFMRELQIMRLGDLHNYLERLEHNPEEPLAAIMSLEALRGRASVHDALEASGIEFDLVIMDEAHAFRNKGTQGNRLAQLVADSSKFLVMLSATPLNLGKEDLFNLMNLLEPHHYPNFQVFRDQVEPNKHLLEARRLLMAGKHNGAQSELVELKALQFGALVAMRPGFKKLEALAHKVVLTSAEKAQVNFLVSDLNTMSGSLNRTRKADTNDFQATRESENVEVVWTKQERDFYEAVHQYFFKKAQDAGMPHAFIMQMPLRQTCSSIPVMVSNLRDKKLLSSELIEEEELAEFEEDEIQFFEEASKDVLLGVPAPETDSKFAAFENLIRRLKAEGQTKLLVFTFFRGTVNYLVQSLEKLGYRVRGIHGGIAPADRYALIDDFKDGEFEIMISNQVGAEGLDFQFCNVLVNYDLPWNPMQVEQRIGRLDRFGQESEKIMIYNMIVPGTIETDIFQRLYDRIKIFTNTVGDLEIILQEGMKSLPEIYVNPNLTPAEREARLEKVEISLELEIKTRESINEDRQSLSILDQLDVEGLSESGPKKGRFISPAEILGHLEYLVNKFGGSVTPKSKDLSVVEFRGTPELASAVSKSKTTETGSELGSALIPILRQNEPITFVLDSRILNGASHPRGTTEIVSSRHPLVRVAQASLADPSLITGRFTDCLIAGAGMRGQYLAMWSVYKTSGIDVVSEMWVTVLDLSDGSRNLEVEDFLLSNPAAIRDSSIRAETVVTDSDLNLLRSIDSERFRAETKEREQENLALIASRIEADRAVEERKLDTHRARYEKDIENGRDESILRMVRGKIEKSQLRLADLEEDFESKKELHPESFTISVAKVTFS
jgi:ERCC4-related helicase